MTLRPLVLEPRAVELVWGGRRLRELLGRDYPPQTRIGETWEVHDENRVLSGPGAGRTLAELARAEPEALLGRRVVRRQGGPAFPLLVKFIDAAAMLSVQVHPDDAYAAAHEGGACGKAEAYVVLDAQPGAKLYYGLVPGADRAALAAALADGGVERLLASIDMRAGDVVYTPAGTVHAFGDGLVLYELQQCSTLTYRLHDWGRLGADGKPRQLHVEQALAVARFPQPEPRACRPLSVPDAAGERKILAAGPHFALESLEAAGASELDGSTFHILTALDGPAELRGERFGAVEIAQGQSVVVPAAAGPYGYAPSGRLLRSYVPDLWADVVEPLRRAGHPEEHVALLGEVGGGRPHIEVSEDG